MSIVVFGSINMDLVARTARFPQPGETATGESFTTVPGGKGANQAVACARLGAPTRIVGRVGSDGFGSALRTSLRVYGVDERHVETHTRVSGIAVITVNAGGENTILVAPGANSQVGAVAGVATQAAAQGCEGLLDGAAAWLLAGPHPDNVRPRLVEIRRSTYPYAPPIPFVPGYESVGIVDAVGPGVTTLREGDRVCALLVHGGYATHVVRGAEHWVKVPEGLDDVLTVVLILNYGTAYQMIHRVAKLAPG